jgi:hypothetical protein
VNMKPSNEQTLIVGSCGTLGSEAEPECPNCDACLGYYAEFGDEIECDNCGAVFALTTETIYHYEVVKYNERRN